MYSRELESIMPMEIVGRNYNEFYMKYQNVCKINTNKKFKMRKKEKIQKK